MKAKPIILVSLIFISLSAAASFVKTPIKQVDPIDAIINIFESHNLVAIDEGPHGNEQSHEFFRTLIANPIFINMVNDIVVECGNSLYQPLMDRFVQGEDIPIDTLRQVWQNTTQPNDVWDRSVYEELFKTVRTINTSLPKEKRLRIILGDPPINWQEIKDMTQFHTWQQKRDLHAAKIIQDEVLNKHRRALIIYGGIHLQRKNIFSNYEQDDNQLLVNQLEKSHKIKVYTIWMFVNSLNGSSLNTTSWHAPSFIPLQGTKLGKIDFSWYYPYKITRGVLHNEKYTVIPRKKWRSLPMEKQFDAIIYLGTVSDITISRLSSSACLDSNYMQMRIQRMTLAGMSQNEVEKFKKQCPASLKKLSLKKYLKNENVVIDPSLRKQVITIANY